MSKCTTQTSHAMPLHSSYYAVTMCVCARDLVLSQLYCFQNGWNRNSGATSIVKFVFDLQSFSYSRSHHRMFIACGETKALSFARKSALFVQLSLVTLTWFRCIPTCMPTWTVEEIQELKLSLMNRIKVGTLVPRKFFLFILAFDDFVFIRYDECMTIFLYHVPSVL